MERLAYNSFCSFQTGSDHARFLRKVRVFAACWHNPLSRFVSSRLDGDKTAISSFRLASWTSDLRVRTLRCRERSLGRLRRSAAAFILNCCWLALGNTLQCRARRSGTICGRLYVLMIKLFLWQWRNDSFLLRFPLENFELLLQFLNPFHLKTNRLQKSYLSL